MVNTKTKIPRVPNVPSTIMILTRGYDTEKAKKTIRDGEVYFDMNGKTILMGIYQGPYEPIKVIEMSVGGGGSISQEVLADLVKKSDVIQDIDTSSSYTPEKVASASAVSALKVDVITNSDKINILEGLVKEGSINPEVEKYIKELLAESELKSSSTITITPVTESHVEIAVNTDKESLDTVTDSEGNEGLGMVWAAYGDSDSGVSEISETEPLATEDKDLNLSASVLS